MCPITQRHRSAGAAPAYGNGFSFRHFISILIYYYKVTCNKNTSSWPQNNLGRYPFFVFFYFFIHIISSFAKTKIRIAICLFRFLYGDYDNNKLLIILGCIEVLVSY
jgi:hypothetical protein